MNEYFIKDIFLFGILAAGLVAAIFRGSFPGSLDKLKGNKTSRFFWAEDGKNVRPKGSLMLLLWVIHFSIFMLIRLYALR